MVHTLKGMRVADCFLSLFQILSFSDLPFFHPILRLRPVYWSLYHGLLSLLYYYRVLLETSPLFIACTPLLMPVTMFKAQGKSSFTQQHS